MDNKIIFNELASNWKENIPEVNYKIVEDIIKTFKIGNGDSLLDVGCGTGILFTALKDKKISHYVGVDISEKMLEEFSICHPNLELKQANFEEKVLFETQFDYLVIYNSIPHFNDLEAVFKNAFENLKTGGTFIIAHSKTRAGLKEHHKRIGHIPSKSEPIPGDSLLIDLSEKYTFTSITIKDDDYFIFSCIKTIKKP